MDKKYILDANIALRSWHYVPYAYYIKNDKIAKELSEEEFNILLLCDGKHEIKVSKEIDVLLKKRLIHEAKEGEGLTLWQKYKDCDNRYMPLMNLEITEKCNYNCLHCFNAVDNNPLSCEFSMEEINRLLDDARDCGINGVLITGGEPMIHKDFMNIVKSIYEHGMYIFELNTNGYFLTQKILDEFKAIGCNPLLKISFDGLGFHDYMRNKKGAEEDAIRAIELCIKNGFEVRVQMQFNKMNQDIILKSLEYLDDIGVNSTRIIRTVEVPRWTKNALDKTLSWIEYYDKTYEIIKEYIKSDRKMDLDFWQIIEIYSKGKCYALSAAKCSESEYDEDMPLCKGTRGMIAISAKGEVYPCMQLSGLLQKKNIYYGNVKKEGLKKILVDGMYMDTICTPVSERYKRNEKCGKCKYWKICNGGCPALGYYFDNEYLGLDKAKCMFFENGYYEEFMNLFPEDWFERC